MPRTEQENARVRHQSRATILAAAMRLFAEQGYERTSVRMIAQEAGVAQGLLYNYFTNKEDVLRALFEQSMDDVRRSFEAVNEAAPDHSLEAIIRASFGIVRDHFDFWRLSYSVRAQPRLLAALGAALHAWTADIVQTLEAHLRAQGYAQPEIEAAILFATVDGISQHYALEPQGYPLDAVIDALVARYRLGGTP